MSAFRFKSSTLSFSISVSSQLRQSVRFAALISHVAVTAILCGQLRATTIPYNLSLDPGSTSLFDIYNPQNPAGANVPVEFVGMILSSANVNPGGGTVVPAHIVLRNPTGTTPSPQAFVDVYYDGAADAFPASVYFGLVSTFQSPSNVPGALTIPPFVLNPDGSITAEVISSYGPPPSFKINHFLTFQAVPGLPFNFFGAGVGLGSAGGYLVVSNPNHVPIDPTVPIAQITVTASGVPEPSSIILAGAGIMALMLVRRARRRRV